MKTRTLARWLSLPMLLLAAAAFAQTPVDVEAGYRWTKVSGNEDMYRTQVNERSGFLIRALTWQGIGSDTSIADHFRVDASDFGTGPAGSLRLDAGKSGKYRLRLGYRHTNFFSALPEFANPLLGQGIIPGQHTYDRKRDMLDVDVDFLSFAKIQPFVGYSLNRYSGPGTTTYHLGQDEFLLGQDLRNVDHEFRAGFGFNTSVWSGSVTEGYRRFHNDETLSLVPGAGAGNNLDPVLGRNITAGGISRTSHDSGSTPFTNAYVTGAFDPRFKLVGNYVRFTAKSDGNESEADTGSFASFALGRFFNGITESIDDHAKNTTWRGGLRGELSIVNNVDLLGSFEREHRNLEGSALINTLYLQSITFGGADPRDLATVISSNNSLERREDVASIALSARPGPWTFRVGTSQTEQNVTVSPDLAEIVVPGAAQGGTFARKIESYDALAAVAAHGFSLGASWKHDHADAPILRTDFVDRDRQRLRAGWTSTRFTLNAMAEQANPRNKDPNFNYRSRIRTYTLDGSVAPTEKLSFYASGARYRADSHIIIIRPETLTTDTSFHSEDGKSVDAGANFAVNRFSVNAGVSRFRNVGTYAFKTNRFHTRLTFDFTPAFGLAGEFDRDRYAEDIGFGDYNAGRYGLYLRWRAGM
ncbi:MAG TPA: hypothetical protein VG323_05165 [Thermoanaerobaculia bacterium]|nr:hypothetical protein [Thermoanaerobaculia bacterium]